MASPDHALYLDAVVAYSFRGASRLHGVSGPACRTVHALK